LSTADSLGLKLRMGKLANENRTLIVERLPLTCFLLLLGLIQDKRLTGIGKAYILVLEFLIKRMVDICCKLR